MYKHHTQGQNIGETTDHFPASNYFKLPYYADTSRLLTVMVDDIPKLETQHWEDSSPVIALFDSFNSQIQAPDYSTLQIFDGQKVSIQFYVDLNQHNVGVSKYEALDRIDEICQCGGPYCYLEEVYSTSSNSVVDYKCVYPPGENNLRFEQKVIVSSKSVPQRYFDEDGASHDVISINTPKQEESNETHWPLITQKMIPSDQIMSIILLVLMKLMELFLMMKAVHTLQRLLR